MTIDMTPDNFLALLECISEGITNGIRQYRAALKKGSPCEAVDEDGGCDEQPEAVPAQRVKAAKKTAKKRVTVAQMTVKILRAAGQPLSKGDILEAASRKYGMDINTMTLSMVLNRALKSGKKIQRVRHGYYTLVPRKAKNADVENAAEKIAEEQN